MSIIHKALKEVENQDAEPIMERLEDLPDDSAVAQSPVLKKVSTAKSPSAVVSPFPYAPVAKKRKFRLSKGFYITLAGAVIVINGGVYYYADQYVSTSALSSVAMPQQRLIEEPATSGLAPQRSTRSESDTPIKSVIQVGISPAEISSSKQGSNADKVVVASAASTQVTGIEEAVPLPVASSNVATDSRSLDKPAQGLNRGSVVHAERGVAAAIPVWVGEFKSLDNAETVYIVMTSTFSSHASRTAKKMEALHDDVFVIPGRYRGESSFYTVVKPNDNRRIKSSIFQSLGIVPFETTVAEVKDRMEAYRTQSIADLSVPVSAETSTALSEQQQYDLVASGSKLVEQGEYQRAATTLKPLIDGDSRLWEGWFWAGSARLGLRDLDTAEQYFAQAAKLNSSSPFIRIQQGIVAQEKGNFAASVDAFKEALTIDYSIPEAHLNLAFSYEALGRINDARLSYSEFLFQASGKRAYSSQLRRIEQHLESLK